MKAEAGKQIRDALAEVWNVSVYREGEALATQCARTSLGSVYAYLDYLELREPTAVLVEARCEPGGNRRVHERSWRRDVAGGWVHL